MEIVWKLWERVAESLVRKRRDEAREIGEGETVPRRMLAVAREVRDCEPVGERWEVRDERRVWIGLSLSWFS